MPTSTDREPSTGVSPARARACNTVACLPDRLLPAVLAHVPEGDSLRDDVTPHLCCALEAGTHTVHQALTLDLPGTDTGAVWCRWPDGHLLAQEATALPDCPAVSPDGGGACCEAVSHPGAHSWELVEVSPISTV